MNILLTSRILAGSTVAGLLLVASASGVFSSFYTTIQSGQSCSGYGYQSGYGYGYDCTPVVTPVVTPSGGGSSSSSTPSVVAVTPTTVPTISTSSNINMTQDTFVKKVSEFKKSKLITTKTSLPKNTVINVFFVLPNGKIRKVGTTRVLNNGTIRYVIKTPGKYKFEQKK